MCVQSPSGADEHDGVHDGAQNGAESPATFASSGAAATSNDPLSSDRLGQHLSSAMGSIASNMKQGLTNAADQKRSSIADGLTALSDSLLQTSQKLSGQGDAMLSPCLKTSADKIHSAAAYLRVNGLPEITQDVSRFTKRHPEIALASAVAAGFLLARVIKSVQADPAFDTARRTESDGTGHEHAS